MLREDNFRIPSEFFGLEGKGVPRIKLPIDHVQEMKEEQIMAVEKSLPVPILSLMS